jgi:hypothetical protein
MSRGAPPDSRTSGIAPAAIAHCHRRIRPVELPIAGFRLEDLVRVTGPVVVAVSGASGALSLPGPSRHCGLAAVRSREGRARA